MDRRFLFILVLIASLPGCNRHEGLVQGGDDARAETALQPDRPMDPLATEHDMTALQGKWELVSVKRDWVEANEKPCLYVFDGATMTVFPEGRRPSYYTLKLDASKTPKQMDIIATWDDGTVTRAEVIYELEGDSFRWCHVDGKRPKTFLSKRNPAGTLNVLRRVEDK